MPVPHSKAMSRMWISVQKTSTQLLAFARTNGIDLTIVGPEAPLVAGIADRFEAAGLVIFGPSAGAAQLEGSKTFTKEFPRPTQYPECAAYRSFTDLDAACAYAAQQTIPIVIKADGLAAGKGVIIAHSHAEADACIRDMLSANRFGEAGHRVVIEDFLQSEKKRATSALSMASRCYPWPVHRITRRATTAISVPIPEVWEPTRQRL